MGKIRLGHFAAPLLALATPFTSEVIGDDMLLSATFFYIILIIVFIAGAVFIVDFRFGFDRHFLFDYDRFKLYPTMVLEFSELKKWYATGKYVPYFEIRGPSALFDVVQYFMEHIKSHQRIERIIRDVPAAKQNSRPNYVVAGVNVTNANQIVQTHMKKRGLRCKCLRSREIRDNDTVINSTFSVHFVLAKIKPFTKHTNIESGKSQKSPRYLKI